MAERIRVFIAGNIYVKRALVRRFLEDDGFEVTGEARNREDMIVAVRRDEPDAVVVDDELLVDGPGGGTIGRLRRAAPDAKLVVFTSTPLDPAAAERLGADGYLEKGLGLASLTALLLRLFAEPAMSFAARADATGPASAAEDASLRATGDEERAATRLAIGATGASATLTPDAGTRDSDHAGTVSRFTAVAAGAVLIAWGLVAMVASGGDRAPVRALDRTDTTEEPAVVQQPDDTTSLDRAYATLDEMIAAIRDGDYVLATIAAQSLIDLREQASLDGFALTGLDASIAARLGSLADDIPTRLGERLHGILGALYPAVGGDPSDPADGPDGVLRPPATTGGGSPTAPDPTAPDPGPPDPTRPDVDPPGEKPPTEEPPTGEPPSEEPPTGEPPTEEPPTEEPGPQPGDGREWGHSHHPHGGPPGHDEDHTPPGHEKHAEKKAEKADRGKPPSAAR